MGSLLQDVLGLFAKKKYAPIPYILDKDDYLVLSTKDKSSLNVMAYLPKVEQTLVSTLILGAAITGASNTSYDYTSAQNAGNVDLVLTGSDATIDIVTLVAGSNIILADDGSNNITISSSAGGGSMNSFDLRGQTGLTHTISNGNLVTITGGAKISTIGSAVDTIEVIHDNTTRTDTTSTATPIPGATFTAIDTITSDVQGHITGVNTKTVTMPSGGGTGSVTSVDATVDGTAITVTGGPITSTGVLSFSYTGSANQFIDGTGALQTVSTGTVTSVTGGFGIDITGTATDPIVNIDYNGVDNAIIIAPTAAIADNDYIWFSDVTDNNIKKTLVSNLPGGSSGVTQILAGTNINISPGSGLGIVTINSTDQFTGTVTSIATSNGTFVNVSGGIITNTGTITGDLSATGVPSISTYLRGDNTWATIPADVNTTYDLDSIQNGADADIRLSGSDGTLDIVKLVAGTNVTLTDAGNTITIDVPSGITDIALTAALFNTTAITASAQITNVAGGTSTLTLLKYNGGLDIGVVPEGGTASTFLRGDGTWVTPAGGSGTVTTVSASTTGDALDVLVTNPTTAPAIDFTWAGNNTQYINGAGDLVVFPTIPTGDVTDVLAGPGITVTNGGGPQPTVEVDYLGVDNYIFLRPTAAPAEGDFIAFHDSSDNNVYKTRFIDFPGYYASWLLTADGGVTQTVTSGNTVTVAGGTAMTTAVTAPDTVTITLDDTSVTPGTYTNTTLTVDQQGRLTFAASGAGAYTWIAEADTGANITVNATDVVDFQGGAGMSTSTLGAIVNFDIDYLGVDNCINIRPIVNPTNEDWFLFSDRTDDNVYKRELSSIPGLYNGFLLIGDQGAGQLIADGNTATIAGGLALSTISTAVDTVTVSHDFFGTAGTYNNITSITTNTTGHVISAAFSVDPLMVDWTLAGDGGPNQLITNGNTVSFLGGLALTTTAAAVDDLVIDHNTFGTPGTYAYPSSIVTNSTGHITSMVAGVAPPTYVAMTSTVLGLGKLFSDIVQVIPAQYVTAVDSRTYGIQFNSSQQLVVNVPWTDNGGVTTVTQGTPGISTGINTPLNIAPTSGAVIVTSNAYAGGNNVGHVPRGGTIETFLRGDGAWAVPTGGGGTGMTSFNITADAGVSQTIVNADVLNFQGGTGITTTGVAGDIIDFNLNLMTTTARGGAMLGSPLTLAIDAQLPEVEFRTYGVHMATGTEQLAVYVPWTDSNGGSMSQWNLTADSGISNIVTNNNVVSILGGTGISTVGSAGDTITISLDDTLAAGQSFTMANISVNAQGQIVAASNGSISSILAAGPGLTLNLATAPDQIEVDYLGLDNIILTAPTLAATENRDYVLVSDASDDNVYKVQLSNLAVSAGIQSVSQTLGFNSTAPMLASITGTVLNLQNNKFSGSNFVGYVPSSSGSSQTTTFLRADGTWQNPGSSVSWNIGGNIGADPIITNDILGIIGTGISGGVTTTVTTVGTTSTMAVTIVPTGVIAGSYTNSNVTVNAQGQITTITNGTAGGGAVTSISSTDGVNSTGENMTVNTNAVGAVTVDTFAYDGGSNVGYVPDGSGNSDKVWLNGQGNWTSPGAGSSTPSSFITDFDFTVRALDMSSGYYGFTNLTLGSFFNNTYNSNSAVFVDANDPFGWSDAARFGCTVFGNAKDGADNCDASAAVSLLCKAHLTMTGSQEQEYIVDLYRWDPCGADNTELVGTATLNTIGSGLPVCENFTLNNADMRFDNTESLFFSVRQTTPGNASAQARVDLRWTGEAAT